MLNTLPFFCASIIVVGVPVVLGPIIVKFLFTVISYSLYVPAVRFNVSPVCAVTVAFFNPLVGVTFIVAALTAPIKKKAHKNSNPIIIIVFLIIFPPFYALI